MKGVQLPILLKSLCPLLKIPHLPVDATIICAGRMSLQMDILWLTFNQRTSILLHRILVNSCSDVMIFSILWYSQMVAFLQFVTLVC